MLVLGGVVGLARLLVLCVTLLLILGGIVGVALRMVLGLIGGVVLHVALLVVVCGAGLVVNGVVDCLVHSLVLIVTFLVFPIVTSCKATQGQQDPHVHKLHAPSTCSTTEN